MTEKEKEKEPVSDRIFFFHVTHSTKKKKKLPSPPFFTFLGGPNFSRIKQFLFF